MLVKMDCANIFGRSGYATQITNYTSGDVIKCPFDFEEVQFIGRRSYTPKDTCGAYYKVGDATQKYWQSTSIYDVAIGASGWSYIISEVGSDYIKVNGNYDEIYVMFVPTGYVVATGNCYKECAVWFGRQGNANAQLFSQGAETFQNGLNLTGDYLTTVYNNSALYIKTKSDLQGAVDVEYYVTYNGNTDLGLQKGTFTANQTIISTPWTDTYTRSIFAGVVK